MGLTQDDVIEIQRLMDESEFGELRLETGDLKLVVRKRGYTPVDQEPAASTNPAATASDKLTTVEKARKPNAEITAPVEEETQGTEAASAVVEEGLIAVRSPILGTFYRTPKPGAPPFVEVGTSVTEDDTVCTVEVMKLFSSIKARARGRITKICAESGQLVEYQQTLFLIEPEGNL
ncbi:acetyl-CoA carboxylase biotin carboxyl carrier protein [Chloroflexota bacterium]